MTTEPPEVTTAYLERLLKTLTEGPMGEALLSLAGSHSALVVKQNRHGEGFTVEIENRAALSNYMGDDPKILDGIAKGTRNGDGTLRPGTWPHER